MAEQGEEPPSGDPNDPIRIPSVTPPSTGGPEGVNEGRSRTQEDTPPAGRFALAGSITADAAIPLTFPFDTWEERVLNPTLERMDNLGRFISGAQGSLAWELLAGDTNFRTNIDALQERLAAIWEDDKGGGVARLEQQLFNLHEDLQDPETPLVKAITAAPEKPTIAIDDLKRVIESSLASDGVSIASLIRILADAQNPPADDKKRSIDDLKNELGGIGGSPFTPIILFLTAILSKAQGLFKPGATAAATAAAVKGADALQGPVGQAAVNVGLMAAFLEIMNDNGNFNPADSAQGLSDALSTFMVDRHNNILQVLGAPQDFQVPGDLAPIQDRATDAVKIALTAGLSAHLWAVLMERFAPGKAMGLSQIAGFMADMSSFQSISRGLWTQVVQASIDRPLDQLYNMQFPTRIPPFGEVLAMYRKHEYDANPLDPATGLEVDFQEDMLRLGVPIKWQQRFKRYVYADPRLYDIIRMADTGLIIKDPDPQDIDDLAHYAIDPSDPDWWFKLKIKKAGYDNIDTKVLVDVIHTRMTAAEKTRLMTQWRNATRKGYFTLADYTERAIAKLETPVAVQVQLEEIIMMRENDRRDALVARYTQFYQADQITLEDLGVALAALIADPDILDRELLEAQLNHNRTVRAKESALLDREVAKVQTQALQIYRTQLKEGLINGETFVTQVLALGVNEQLAQLMAQTQAALQGKETDLLLERNQTAEERRIRDLLAQAYEAQLDSGEIEEEELSTLLLAAGFTPPHARAVVARALSKKIARLLRSADTQDLQEAQRLQAAVIARVRQELRHSLITPAQAATDLAAAAIPTARAQEILREEAARSSIAS